MARRPRIASIRAAERSSIAGVRGAYTSAVSTGSNGRGTGRSPPVPRRPRASKWRRHAADRGIAAVAGRLVLARPATRGSRSASRAASRPTRRTRVLRRASAIRLRAVPPVGVCGAPEGSRPHACQSVAGYGPGGRIINDYAALIDRAAPLYIARFAGDRLLCVVGDHGDDAQEATWLAVGGAPICAECLG